MRLLKPKHIVDWYCTESNKSLPQTTTQEMLQSGGKRKQKFRIIHKKQLGLNSYSGNDFRLQLMNFELTKSQPLISSYKRDYAPPYDDVCQPLELKESEPDYSFNRKPVNDFGIERLTASEFMFMDDHFINITQARLKINMQRQLRNTHIPLV